jgi:hypothetical protein
MRDWRGRLRKLWPGAEGEPLPLLLGHSECPGFTGPPIGEDAWREILRTTYQLQFAIV